MSKKTLILILTGAVVIIGVVLFFVLRSSSDSYYNIQIMETLGGVKVDRDNSQTDAYAGMKMRSGDNLKVMSDGFTRINCDRETYSRIEHDTEVSFVADSDKKRGYIEKYDGEKTYVSLMGSNKNQDFVSEYYFSRYTMEAGETMICRMVTEDK